MDNPSFPGKDNKAFLQLYPVSGAERIEAIDVLRGFALLGILVINIVFFALPQALYFNPPVAGGFTGLNLLAWKFSYIFFFQKAMALFSMLFGAGLILMSDRAATAGRSLRGVYYRRIVWLLIFGLIHGYLLWYGDILFTYALCGLLLYLFRRCSVRTLIILGVAVLLCGILVQVASGYFNGQLRDEAARVQSILDAGKTINPQQERVLALWKQFETMFEASPDEIAAEVKAYRGGYTKNLAFRIPVTVMMQTQALIFLVFWRALGLMLLGMGLMKLRIFSGERSLRFYSLLSIGGLGIGLPLAGYGAGSLMEHDFDFIYQFSVGAHYNYLGAVLAALGYTGVVMIICKLGLLRRLTRRLAAVGRMALTNYLMQTVICTAIFYGFGLGLFGRIERLGLLGFVLGIWIFQVYFSTIWLKRFRFGPAEWLWRSLTYRRRQPMRIVQQEAQN
ncbi:MAG: DUF418 domain-containing protein [Candidatus Zixiibacteriota bacterium]|nr:MAG: DUF418 domain-containing protein [candidate division Zixibacteria bacterium]